MGDQELEFRYKTVGDLKAAEDFLKLLKDQKKAAEEAETAEKRSASAKAEREADLKSRVVLQQALHQSTLQYQKEKETGDRAELTRINELHQAQARVLEQAKARASEEVTARLKKQAVAQQQNTEALQNYFQKARANAAFFEKQSREAQRAGGITAGELLQSVNTTRPSAFKRASAAYSDAGGGMAGIRAGAAAIGPGAAAGFAVVAGAAVVAAKSIKEYADAEERVAKLDAALAQQGLLVEGYRTRLQNLAQTLQDTTAISGEAWTQVLTTLTQFGSTPDTIGRDTEAVKALAGIMGGDLSSAAIMVGKALNGSFEAFSRLGITFDENATKAQKLKHVFDEIGTRGTGQLEAYAASMKGRTEAMKQATEDLLKAFGQRLSSDTFGSDGKALGQLTTALKFWADMIGKTIPKSTELQNAIHKTRDASLSGEDAARSYAKELDRLHKAADGARSGLSALFEDIDKHADQDKTEKESAAKAELAKIDQLEQEHGITPMEATSRRNNINANLAKEDAKRTDDALTKKRLLSDAAFMDTDRQIRVADTDKDLQERKLKEGEEFAKKQADIEKKYAPKIRSAKTVGDENGRLKAEADRSRELRRLQDANPEAATVDMAKQPGVTQAARDNARDVHDLLDQDRANYLRQGQSIFDQQRSNQKVVRNNLEAMRIEGTSHLLADREQERGPVRNLPGGGMEGSRDAVRLAQQSDQGAASMQQVRSGPGGEQRYRQIQAAVDTRVQNDERLIEILSQFASQSPLVQARIRKLEDEVRLLVSQSRNRSN